MKKILLIFLIIILGVSCKNTKQLYNLDNSVEIKMPFNETDYKTENNFISIGDGLSPYMSTAISIGQAEAKRKMSNQLSILIENVTEIYFNQRNTFNNLNTFDEISRQTSVQFLENIKIIDEKLFFNKKQNLYNYWVVIEISKERITDDYHKEFEEKEVYINRNDFRKILDEQINKITN